jgi:uncharacterized protein GlcG (DUF336 family)
MALVESHSSLTWPAALTAAQAAVNHGLSIGRTVCVTVVDRAGHTLASLRCPGAPLHSMAIAADKAYTAVSFGLPTGGWAQAVGDDVMLRDGLAQRDRMVMFAGGLPIAVDGQRVGAIGVSGASADEDAQCAQAGIDAMLRSA